MLDVKQATKLATAYLINLYDQQLSTSDAVRLEEVELTEDGKYWLITLSFNPANPAAIIFPPRREYKVFRINAETGELQSMKIREVA
jgi:hypothetical protein